MVKLSLEEKIKGCIPRGTNIIETIYGTSGPGQRYAIVVTKVLWYAVRLIVDNGAKECEAYSQQTTIAGVKQKIEQYKEAMSIPSYSLYRESNLGTKVYAYSENVTSWKKEDIPSILKRGDVISLSRTCGILHNEAVYLGDLKVAHIAGDSQSDTGARISPFIGSAEEHPFVKSEGQPFEIQHFRFILKTHEEIAQRAEGFANENLWKGQYHLFGKNSLDFAAYCAQ